MVLRDHMEALVEVGWTKESARENERQTVGFKGCRVKADWFKEGEQKDDWATIGREFCSVNRLAAKYLESRQFLLFCVRKVPMNKMHSRHYC